MADNPTPPPTRPRIYVASLADYNNGLHHGVWIDAAQDPSDIFRAIQSMLTRSRVEGAEEWAIHDYEGFGPLRIAENASIQYVSEVANGIYEFGEAYIV